MSNTQDSTPETPIDARTFKDFDLNKHLIQALDDKGYETPTEIQQKTLDAFATGKHIVGQSQTGTGKTAAFVLPVLNAIDTKKRQQQVLVLAPTRELAHQIRDEVFDLSKHLYMRSMTAFGGQSKRRQIENLEKGAQVVIGTVGRVKDLIDMRKMNPSDFDYFILDEVDRMLDMGFIDDIDYIWSRCINVKQALTFSATMPNEMKELLQRYIGGPEDYVSINVAPQKIVAAKVDHKFMEVPAFKKYDALKRILQEKPEHKTIIFAETKRLVDDLARQLSDEGFEAIALHGDMEQRDRFHTLKKIKNNDLRVLVATDVAARGLNMNQIDLVINFEVPRDPESYVHRIGRTARAGAEGEAIMFVTGDEYSFVHAIERRSKMKIKRVDHTGAEVTRTDFRARKGGGRGRGRGGRGGKSHGNGGYSRYRKPGGGGSRGGRSGGNRGGSTGGFSGSKRGVKKRF